MANLNPSNDAAHKAKREISKEKAREVKRQIEHCISANERITLLGIAKRAGVSRAFIYNSQELRELIESHKVQANAKVVAHGLSSKRDQQKIKGLQNKLEAVIAKSKNQALEIVRLQKENDILKQHIEKISADNIIPISRS